MRYALSASEKAFKDSFREFAEWAIPSAGAGRAPEGLSRELGHWLAAQKPDGLSRVEEVVVMEELGRRCPAAAPGLVAAGPFGSLSLSPGLRRAAANLGAAQGILAPGLAGVPAIGGPRGTVLQSLADALAGIEAARLKLYRAAILEDAGRGDAGENAGAESLAGALARTAGILMERITTGGKDETGSAVQEGDRNGDRQRPEGPGGGPEGPRG